MRARTLRQTVRWLPIKWLAATSIFSVFVWFAACTNLDDLIQPDCAYTVAPSTIDVGNQGGTGTLTIRAPGVCAWAVESASGWVSLAGERSGKGDGSLGYAVAAHEGFDYRYATLTVAGKSVTVSQAGRPLPPPPPVCSYSVSPATVSAAAAGGPGSIAVAAPAACAWTASSQTGWLTITSGASGSGSGAFSFTITANTASAGRTGSMSAGGQGISVTQAGTAAPPPNCNYTISPTSAKFPTLGGTGTINVTAQAGCAWTAVPQQSWITIVTGASGSGNGQVQYLVAVCGCGSDRSGRIVVAGRNFNIDQDGGKTP